jgi:hypothetical protein
MTRTGAIVLCLAALMLSASNMVKGQELPLGDGHVADHPAVGNVYACRTTFRTGAARHDGPWFHGESWNPAEKPHVAGSVLWPNATFTLTPQGNDLLFQGNSLPMHQPTGIFPIGRSDSVYRYDTNPNRIAAQHLSFTIPATPVVASSPHCLPMGMIGFTVTGVALYNALDDAGRDAAAHEIQDLCDGHPQANSQYHYHSGSPCIPGLDTDKLVGWALDGFPILGMKDAKGVRLANADLDACHGRAERVTVNGRTYQYAYHFTREYPYALGCFKGRLVEGVLQKVRDGLLPSRRRGRQGGGRGQRDR